MVFQTFTTGEILPYEMEVWERIESQSTLDVYDAIRKSRLASRSKYLWALGKDYAKAKKSQDIDILDKETDFANTMEDIDKYIWYAKEDYIRNMAKNDNNLAYALQQATESYSAGNIFGSGLALQKQRRVMQQNQAPDIKTAKDRRLDELDTNKDRAQFEMDEIVRPKIDMAKDDLEDRFRKARGRAPGVPTLQEFASRPDEYLTF